MKVALKSLVVSILLMGAQPLWAALPNPIGDIVNDFAGVIDESTVKEMEGVLDRVEHQTGVELSLVTVKSLSAYEGVPRAIDKFAEQLFNQWGVGHQDVNNGVLILVALKEKRVRFQFGSDFTEEDIAAMKTLFQEKILPYFRNGDLTNASLASAMYAAIEVTQPITFWEYYRLAILFGVLALGALVLGIVSRKKNRKGPMKFSYAAFLVLLVLCVKDLARTSRVDGFGGGTTAGVGLTERWNS
jgi:hypothetical protein